MLLTALDISTVQPGPQCSLVHSAAWSTVQPGPQCSLDHSAAGSTVQPGPQCSLVHSAAWSTVQSGPQCSLDHSAAWSTVQPGPQCSLVHSSAWGFAATDENGEHVEAWAEAQHLRLIHDAKLPSSFNSDRMRFRYNTYFRHQQYSQLPT